MITATNVQELREKTGVGMMDCKKALQESNGDVEKAVVILRKKGVDVMNARQGKEASEGFIGVYSHGGKIGVMVEVNSETDFVAKNAEFQEFANNVAMHIAAAKPKYLTADDMDEKFVEGEKAIWIDQLKEQGKPEQIIPKIIEGKMKKLAQDVCLMNQAYVKDTDKSIEDLLGELVAKMGEKIVIKKFERFEIGV